jgi:5-formyltetrahydrofolate cyclo-ligase
MRKQDEKRTLRSIMRRLEDNLSPRYMHTADEAIVRHLIALPEYREARTVFCFVGVKREINTIPLLQDTLAAGKTLCVPLCIENGIMEARQISDLSQLQTGKYGLLEPAADAPPIAVDDIDFAVIPCTTCNHAGQRLGKGGGYYDRFLSHYRGGTVMLCREKLIREEIPVEPHDYPIPWVMTERGLYEDGIPARLY